MVFSLPKLRLARMDVRLCPSRTSDASSMCGSEVGNASFLDGEKRHKQRRLASGTRFAQSIGSRSDKLFGRIVAVR